MTIKKQKVEIRIAAHPTQVAIAQLVAGRGINDLTLREIGSIVAIVEAVSPQQVKHHLGQMVKYGFLDIIGGKYQLGKALR